MRPIISLGWGNLFFCLSLSLLTACGGGGGGDKTNHSTISTSSSASTSSLISSSASSFPLPETLPANFPTGTTESLPVLNITTENAVAVTSKENYINGSYELTDAGAVTEGTLEIRGRGNSTWDWPKKPYRLKLTNAKDLLGMPSSKHWVLLANYADKTLIRNDIALMFSENLGMEYTVKAKYVEVNFNGSYQGVYQLVEHLRVAKDRVNIPELKVTDTTSDKVSGGYLMEVDFRHHVDFCNNITYAAAECAGQVNIARDVDYCIDSTHGMNPFCIDTPENLHDNAWLPMRDYITEYITDTETALFGSNFADPATGYAAYIDVDSVINYYIINELFKNVDGAVASFYLYKKRDGKLFFGPIWDFDLALGNTGYDNVDQTNGWHIRQATWFARLFEDPAFAAKVKARWQTIKAEGKIGLIFEYAQARATWLNTMQAKNFQKWPIFDWTTWYTRVIMGSYTGEVNEMIRWQHERAVWMDAQLSQ
jgi:hypothetical protein